MALHTARIEWENQGEDYLKGKYSREHRWIFDGGANVPASSSPAVVPVTFSNPAGVDPEEAFVASLASCHMLTFLFLAQKAGYIVERYQDDAAGSMAKGENGVPWISEVRLRPVIVYSAEKRPGPEEETALHEKAHEQCFVANSVKTKVVVESPGT
jgi:organic hydroperoxide reductase OsmC/OhrA